MRECFFCGRRENIERHHVYYGQGRRKISEKYGAVVDLCHYCHNEPPDGVHQNPERRRHLEQLFQFKLMEEQGWDTQEFIDHIGRNYL